ncbi:NADPH-dependent 7-cyano-7-deazaguanine reductase QueF [Fulvimonas soli]|jgi:7-cyano-7-deazaguanine reductase|uniref:NADPH-dependent 7-cyano-7-deazaguanine reductase n=1 Tax=Fulvimonas soli TaxID=155197 RepID=A0A316IGS9_9GAMM|nr:NADPH-dependent 7-cyano-7-deazaguanine reductase QueF [Fulvimonas soli]PWK92289.1 7-cyano-7-deazaguanine reductase [Fulvimonas soli]TNY25827.1 NADPH-dependent 7-cyano-7-deazaguanine reductase QueF [Fulvimonas soli]
MSTPEHSPLGKATVYADRYDPALLFPIPRAPKRAELGLHGALPFRGVDVWNAYELSWLDARGKPRVALAEFRVPADSPNIVESKSFKLYLNGFAQERVADEEALAATLARDLSAAAGAPVGVALHAPSARGLPFADLDGDSIDALELDLDDYGPPKAGHLRADASAAEVEETLVSDLLRSNCPVTGQPDWGSVQIRYRGAPIDRAGLLRYLVSFRTHSEFHEQCVERIFVDVMARCAPRELSVYARYTRRGGLDINPFRSTDPQAAPGNPRGARQ